MSLLTGKPSEQLPVVVAFGASAGGLQALRPIIRGLKRRGRATYVVAHHMSPVQPSNLPELLADRSELVVVSASVPALPLV